MKIQKKLLIAAAMCGAAFSTMAQGQTLLWSNDLETTTKFNQIYDAFDNDPDPQSQISHSPSTANCNGSGSQCIFVRLKRPDYTNITGTGDNRKGTVVNNYNVNEQITMPGVSVREGTLQYRVRIDTDFPFMIVGKLPGLSPDNMEAGGDKPNNPQNDGWSTRLMWVRSGSSHHPSLYMYDQNRPQGSTGEQNPNTNIDLEADGLWHDVTMYVRLNTSAGSANGVAAIFWDGQLVACRRNVKFWDTTAGSPNVNIKRLAFHNYYGGGATDLRFFPEANADEKRMSFDNFKFYSGKETPNFTESNCDATSNYN